MNATQTRPLAVVTGASSGIGFELAKQFALNGFDLLIVAEDPDVRSAAAALQVDGAEVDVLQLDLTAPTAVDDLYARIKARGRPVEAIALNAGVGAGGAFAGPGE